MSEPRRARAPWVVWGLEVLLLVPAVVLLVLNGKFSGEPFFTAATLTMIVGYSTVGALVVSRGQWNPVGWLLMTVGVALLLARFSVEYIEYADVTNPGSLPAGSALAIASTSFWLGKLASIILFPLAFPSGRGAG